MIWSRDSFVLTDEPHQSAIQETYELLQTTYWAHKRPLEIIPSLLHNSVCFFLLQDQTQIGFARVITDHLTTSWICDVVIRDRHQGNGLGTWMMQCLLQHPDLTGTQFVLQTGSARLFYERLGFSCHHSLMGTPVDYL